MPESIIKPHAFEAVTIRFAKPADEQRCRRCLAPASHAAHGPQHVHDFAVSISAGDVPADLMAGLAQQLYRAAQAVCEDWMKDHDIEDEALAERLAAVRVHASISYDGRRDCDLAHE